VIVVDASAWVYALVVSGARADATRELLAADPRWVAPAHMPLEVLRTLRKGVSLGDLTPGEGSRCARLVTDTSIELIAPGTRVLERVWVLRDNVSIYDAPYIAVAEAFGVPLITVDGRLARAARVEGVDAIVPGSPA